MADTIYDGTADFSGGQDASRNPMFIPENCYYAGVNVMVHDSVAMPRWPLHKKKLDFSNTGTFRLANLALRKYEDHFYQGRFQAIIPYSIGHTYYQIYIVSGIIFLINQRNFQVTVLEIQGGSRLNENEPRLYWEEAGKELVIHDAPNKPVLVHGLTARRSNLDKYEVPVSRLGTYNQNRLFIANANEFTAGDPVGLIDPTVNPPISFKEIQLPGSDFYGQIFQLSTNYNNDLITAMTFLPVVDTSTGIGPMLVATKKSVWSYSTQNQRSNWTQGQFGSMLLNNVGIVGGRAYTAVHSDFFFMGADYQLRALSMSRDEQQKWSKAPMSREVKNWLKYWEPNKNLIDYTVVGYFKNKVFVTANPYRCAAKSTQGRSVSDYAFGGMVVLELDNVGNMSTETPPAWSGLWTGCRPMDFSKNDERFFIASKDNGKNQLYELVPESNVDIIDGEERLIRSRLYTRFYNFKTPLVDKKLQGLEFQIDNIRGNFTMDVRYRAGHGSNFASWKKGFTFTAPDSTKGVPDPKLVNGFAAQSFRRLNFGDPAEAGSNPVLEENYKLFRKVQLLIDITGKSWELNQIVVKATAEQQDERNLTGYKTLKAKPLSVDYLDDWAIVG